MTDDPKGNSILINAIGNNGLISYAGAVSTGGTGLHGNPGSPPMPDGLFSQGAIQVAGNHLFLVNAGSNTVSMFFINPVNPLDIRMVGKPVSSGGEFPVSLAVSPSTGDVCVLNGGKVNGVSCFSVDSQRGMTPRGKFYSFGLNATTPPSGPPNTVSHVLFSEDGSHLYASVKGTSPSTPGFIATWQVASDGSLSSTFKKTHPPFGDGYLPFGISNIPGSPNSIFVADPGLGATIYDLSGQKPAFSPLNIEGQGSVCWIAYAESTKSYLVSDPTTNNIYEVSLDSANDPTLINTYGLQNQTAPTDLAVASVLGKEYLYILSPPFSSFIVYELRKGAKSKLLQSYAFESEVSGVPLEPVNLSGAAVYTIF